MKHRYLSILKFKAAERDAVRQLANGIWDLWNPLFEILPEDEELDAGYWPGLLNRISHGIETSCTRPGAMILLDFDKLEGLQVVEAVNPVQRILESIRQLG